MKRSNQARRALLATLLAGTTVFATGCSSGGFPMASLNPFSNSGPAGTASGPNWTESVASTTGGARNQMRSVGSTAKNAWGKTTGAVTGLFAAKPKEEGDSADSSPDPLRLDNKPKSISPEVFVANGQLWESTGDFDKAMGSYVKALQREPNNAPALTSIARLHFRQGEHQKAAEFFQKAIEQSPNDAGLYNDLGLTLSKLGNHTAAAQTLQRALQIAPGTSRYANNLASIRFEAGDPQAAYQVLTQNNKPAVAHFNMAYLHFKKGQMNDARGHLGQAMQFEGEAEEDPATKRAIDRSRDMLAQISGSGSPVAQAGPQTAIAGLPKGPTVKQASQSSNPGTSPHISPASQVSPSGTSSTVPSLPSSWKSGATTTSSPTPSMGGIVPNSGAAVPNIPANGGATTPAPSAGDGVSLPETSVSATPAPQTSPSNPSSPSPQSQPTGGSEQPSVPFSLPPGFNFGE